MNQNKITSETSMTTTYRLIALMLLIALAALAAVPAFAAPPCSSPTGDPCKSSGPTSTPVGEPTGVLNPIDVASGNKYSHEADLPALPGPLGLELVRHYNSLSAYSGRLGANWSTGYEAYLYVGSHHLQLFQGDGKGRFYHPDAKEANLYTHPNPAAGDVLRVADGSGRTWYHWRWQNGRTVVFQQVETNAARLVRIEELSGERLALTYGPAGELQQVIDPQGRKLTFIYAPWRRGEPLKVEAVDTPIGRFRYEHDAQYRLVRVTAPHGAVREYLYEAERQAGHARALTGIRAGKAGANGQPDPKQWVRLSTYAYDAKGRAVLSERTDGSEYGTVEYVRPAQEYRPGPAPKEERQGGLAVLTNRYGAKTTYRMALVAGEYALTEVQGPGCSSCGPTNIRYAYDARSGQLRSVTHLAADGTPIQTTTYTYDAAHRPVRMTRQDYEKGRPRGAPVLVERREYPSTIDAKPWRTASPQGSALTDYGNATRALPSAQADQALRPAVAKAAFWLPTLIARPSVVAGREHVLRITYGDAVRTRLRVAELTEEGFAPELGAGGTTLAPPVALQRTLRYRYNPWGELAEIDGAVPGAGDVIRFERDAQGRLIRTRYPAESLQEVRRYDELGRLVQLTPTDAVPVQLTYDGAGRVNGVERAGQKVTIQRDSADRIERLLTVPGEVLSFTYESNAVQVRSSAGWSRRTENERTADGAQVTEIVQTQLRKLVTSRHFDEQGRLIEERLPDGSQTSLRYTADGVQTEDALGRVYQSAVARSNGAALAALPGVWLNGSLRGQGVELQSHLGQVKGRWKDDFGRVVLVHLAERGWTRYRYDESGRLVERLDADGGRVRMAYDPSGRLTRRSVHGADGQVVSTEFGYHGAYLVRVQHPNQVTDRRYDRNGRLESVVTTQLGHQYREQYRYDAAGLLVGRTLPDGSELRLTYDPAGQPQSLALRASGKLGWETVAHVEVRDGREPTVVAFANGTRRIQERNAGGTLQRIAHVRATRRSSLAEIVIPPAHAGANEEALLDWRYTFDAGRRLVQLQEAAAGTEKRYGYDLLDRLIIAQTHPLHTAQAQTVAARPMPATAIERLAFDRIGNLFLHQNVRGATQRLAYGPANRLTQQRQQAAAYDAVGRPVAWRDLRLSYGVEGRLATVRRGATLVQSNLHNAWGERIQKTTASGKQGYLYHAQRLAAELDAEGRIQSQYLYFDGQPVARLECQPACVPVSNPPAEDRGWMNDATQSLGRGMAAIKRLAGASPHTRLLILHTDHLGTLHAVSDDDTRLVWRAEYDALGHAVITAQTVRIDLRLAGQVADAETGLHDNYLRTYDPQTGRYLEPDPLGWRGDAHPYLYAGGHFTQASDPLGLVLFAFDGTGNDASNPKTLSNVLHFRDAYESGPERYITGVGTNDPASGIKADPFDVVAAVTGKERVAYMIKYFRDYMAGASEEVIDIDIVGFSRGAAMARDFLNELVAKTKEGRYSFTDPSGKEHSHCVNFRFLGLWDTVLSTHSGTYNLSIPAEVKHVAHAVALNEYRTFFPGESIEPDSKHPGSETTRVERGFLGSHSDIGGSFEEGELAKIALIWMVDQAQAAGVTMKSIDRTIDSSKLVYHDKSNNPYVTPESPTGPEDRIVKYADGTTKNQKVADIAGMTTTDTLPFLKPYAVPKWSNVVGTVDAKGYIDWLEKNGYDLGLVVK